MMNYYVLSVLGDANDSSLVLLDQFGEGIKNLRYRVAMGERIGPDYPEDANILLSKKRKGVVVKPFIGNTVNMIAGTGPLKEAVVALCSGIDIEYLPFKILDHRKRVLSADLWIINPIGTFDCLDLEASEVTRDDEDPAEILRIENHALDARKLKDAPDLFRPHHDEQTYVLSQRLVDEMKARGVTNLKGQKVRLTHTNKSSGTP